MIRIAKRDEHLVPFDKKKIINAINKAFIEIDGVLYETDTATDIANDIEDILFEFKDRNKIDITYDDIDFIIEESMKIAKRRYAK